jgi:HemY protein
MIKTVLFIGAATVVVAVALWLAGSEGVVTLSAGDWQIGVPLPVFLFAVLLVAVLAALVYRFWRGMRRAPAATRAFFRRREKEKGYRALTQGMVAVAAGDANEAAKQAKRADALLAEPPLTMLLSAQAAQLNGDETAAKRYFTAMLDSEDTAFLGLRGLLMQAQRDGHDTEALELARRARALQPKTPWVLTTLFDLQVSEKQWREAIETVDQAAKQKAMEPDTARRVKATLMLACSQEAENATNLDEAVSLARKAHSQMPEFLPASIQLATLLADQGKKRAAVKVIEESWAKTPHPALATLYERLESVSDPLKAVQRVEKLANTNRDHPDSHVALAEAMLKAKIWGAARSHLDSAGGDEPSARVCRLMATLEENEAGDMASARTWLLRATYADPDPAWICADCGSAAAGWEPICPRCGALGTLDWKVPPRASVLDGSDPSLLPVAGYAHPPDANLPMVTPTGVVPVVLSPTPFPAPPDIAGERAGEQVGEQENLTETAPTEPQPGTGRNP